MTNELPDAISTAALMRLAQAARAAQGRPPVGDTLPEIPLADDGSGILDLTITIEQVILRSRGANLLQMLHASSYLLDACKESLTDQLGAMEIADDEEVLMVQAMVLRDTAALEHCLAVLNRMLDPLTEKTIELRDLDHRRAGNSDYIGRAALVSNASLQALGLDPGVFDDYFFGRLDRGEFRR